MSNEVFGALIGLAVTLGPVLAANLLYALMVRTAMTDEQNDIISPPPPGKYTPKAVDAIVSAYYPRRVSAVDTARARAQSAYAIASTLAGVLVGAGLLTTLEDRPMPVRILGIVALIGWLAAAGLYLRAVASPVIVKRHGAQRGANNFVERVLEQSSAERDEIDARLKLANRASFFALVATAATVSLALLIADDVRERGTVVLTDSGAVSVGRICPQLPVDLVGEIKAGSIGSETLVVKADAGQCDEVAVDLVIARSAVAAVRTEVGTPQP